jgi:hypothetical protein
VSSEGGAEREREKGGGAGRVGGGLIVVLLSLPFSSRSPGDEVEIEEDDGLDEDGDGDADDAGGGRRAGGKSGGRAGGGGGTVSDDEDGGEEVLLREAGPGTGGSGSGGGVASSSSSSSSSGVEGKEADAGGTGSLEPSGPPLGILESTVDPVAWRAELERVAPRLKQPALPGAAGGASGPGGGSSSLLGGGAVRGEWRAHLEQTRAAEGVIAKYLPFSRDGLERLGGDLADVLEAVSARERSVNAALKHLAADYRGGSERQAQLQESVTRAQTRVTGLSNELAAVSEALEDVKAQMEERGSSMTDTSPLIRIKAALSNLRGEIKTLDLQLGVCGHAVMQHRISHKMAGRNENGRSTVNAAAAAAAEGGEEDD